MTINRRYDVVVIGAGLAGVVAAAAAAGAGAKVGVVSRGPGNLALWSGLVSGPMQEEPARRPAGASDRAVGFFLRHSQAAGLPYRSGRQARLPGDTFHILAPSGRPVRARLAPETMAPGDVRSFTGGRTLLLVGFTELADYPAAFIAARARAQAGLAVEARSLSLGTAAGRGSPVRVARLFDAQSWFAAFLDSAGRLLRAELSRATTAAVAVPPVLGVLRASENLARLTAAWGRPVFELPALPPSIPGSRFWTFWRHRLETTQGVRLHLGRTVISFAARDGRCLRVTDDAADAYEASAFVLATGGVAGGGLTVSPTAFLDAVQGQTSGTSTAVGVEEKDRGLIAEPIFGLPTAGPLPAGPDERPGSDPRRAWRCWGVKVGTNGASSTLANVFVAGWELGGRVGTPSEVAGPDALLSIETGWRAGIRAARCAAATEPDRGETEEEDGR